MFRMPTMTDLTAGHVALSAQTISGFASRERLVSRKVYRKSTALPLLPVATSTISLTPLSAPERLKRAHWRGSSGSTAPTASMSAIIDVSVVNLVADLHGAPKAAIGSLAERPLLANASQALGGRNW